MDVDVTFAQFHVNLMMMMMSDETDVNCRRFIELEGLDVFQQCLKVRPFITVLTLCLLARSAASLHRPVAATELVGKGLISCAIKPSK